jgi:hypothetical protein
MSTKGATLGNESLLVLLSAVTMVVILANVGACVAVAVVACAVLVTVGVAAEVAVETAAAVADMTYQCHWHWCRGCRCQVVTTIKVLLLLLRDEPLSPGHLRHSGCRWYGGSGAMLQSLWLLLELLRSSL